MTQGLLAAPADPKAFEGELAADDPSAAVPDAELDTLISDLRTLHLQAGLGHSLAVGRLLIERLYGGSVNDYHSRNPHKQARLRALLQRRAPELADLNLREQALRNSILAVEVWYSLPEAAQEALSFPKLVELAVVKDPEARQQIGYACVRDGWTSQEFKAALDPHRPPARPRQPAVLRDIGLAARNLRAYDRAALADLSPKHLTKLEADLAELLAAVKRLSGKK